MDRRFFDVCIGNQIYEARVLHRLTQEQLVLYANQAWLSRNPDRKKGCSRSVYVRYEKGEVSMPMNFFKSVCEVLGLEWKDVYKKALDYEYEMISKDNFDKK